MNEDDEFVQPASHTTAKVSTKPVPFADDGGEPDFAMWLEAQAQKKKIGSSKPLPKGLSKSTTAKRLVTKPAAKPVVAKKLDMKPKEVEDDDAWGDGW